MKKLPFIFIGLLSLSLFLYSCEEEDTVIADTEVMDGGIQISGNALIDNDGDGIGDIAAEGALVYYGDSILIWDNITPGEEPAPADNIPFAYVDAAGNYTIENLTESEGAVLIHYLQEGSTYCSPRGTDTTPDGDPAETTQYDRIHVTLTADEHDTGNNFVFTCY